MGYASYLLSSCLFHFWCLRVFFFFFFCARTPLCLSDGRKNWKMLMLDIWWKPNILLNINLNIDLRIHSPKYCTILQTLSYLHLQYYIYSTFYELFSCLFFLSFFCIILILLSLKIKKVSVYRKIEVFFSCNIKEKKCFGISCMAFKYLTQTQL